jgi:phage/plasmid-associated DNA primase
LDRRCRVQLTTQYRSGTLVIPFRVTIPRAQQDPLLKEKLKAELPGILNWTSQLKGQWSAASV